MVAEASILHPVPIKLVFYEYPQIPLFRGGFVLKMLSALIRYGVAAQQCPAGQLIN